MSETQQHQRPAGWPDMYSAAGRSPDCPHQMHWAENAGVYRCIYECGETDSAPPENHLGLESDAGDTESIVDGWYLKASDDGLLVAGSVDGRVRAVRYSPDAVPLRGVLVRQSDLDEMKLVHGSQIPTPAREHVQEVHRIREQKVAALHEAADAATDGESDG